MKHISVIGTGYVGLVSGVCFAEIGHSCTCVDIDAAKVERINRGELPIHEQGLAPLLARHVGRVNHVHCKDIRRSVLEQAWATDMSFMDAVLAGIFTVPGDGSVDYPPLLARLAEAGYSGWLVVEAEQDPARANPLTYATMGYRNLRRMAEAAGFTVSD